MKAAYVLPGQHRLVAAIALLYAGAWLGYTAQIEIGLFPNPENTALLQSALDWASGELAEGTPKTFYLFILSILARVFETTEFTLLGVRIFNSICFALIAGFCAAASSYIWRKNRSIWISGLLIGLNPVIVFWTSDPSPALPALTCVSFAIWKILHWMRNPNLSDSIAAGLALAVGAALNTSLIAPALIWPLIALLYPKKHGVPNALAAALSIVGFAVACVVFGFQLQAPLLFELTQAPANLYHLFSSYEPSDLKHYALYHRLHYLLLYNPIYFGIILTLATGGVYARFKNGHKGRSILVLGSLGCAFTLLYLFQEPSCTARLGILPILAILAGGAASIPHIWRVAGGTTRSKISIVALAIVSLSFSSFFIPREPTVFLKDMQYLAQANLHIHHNEKARIWAKKSLEIDPKPAGMQAVLIESKFDEWALLSAWRPIAIEEAELLLEETQIPQDPTAEVQIIQGIYLWKLKEAEAATALWKAHADSHALARLSLYWTNQKEKPLLADLAQYPEGQHRDTLESALSVNRSSPTYGMTERKLDNIFTYAH